MGEYNLGLVADRLRIDVRLSDEVINGQLKTEVTVSSPLDDQEYIDFTSTLSDRSPLHILPRVPGKEKVMLSLNGVPSEPHLWYAKLLANKLIDFRGTGAALLVADFAEKPMCILLTSDSPVHLNSEAGVA